MTALTQRLEDLGLVVRDNQKAPYVLQQPDEVSALLLHLAALGVALGHQESQELESMEEMARRARFRVVDQEAASEREGHSDDGG